jgi:hypothetical protein
MLKRKIYKIISEHDKYPPCDGKFVAEINLIEDDKKYIYIEGFGCSRNYTGTDREVLEMFLAEHGAELKEMELIDR